MDEELINPSYAGTKKFQYNQVNTMADDALAPMSTGHQ